MTNSIYSEYLTPDNAVLAMIDHQTGLMVGLGDEHPTVLKNNILGLVNTAKRHCQSKCTGYVDRLNDQLRRANAQLPEHLQLTFLDAGEHEAGD